MDYGTWQPIDTAPKDRPILAYEGGFFDVVDWSDLGEWRSHYETVEPTHWMELPSPPEAAQSVPQKTDPIGLNEA